MLGIINLNQKIKLVKILIHQEFHHLNWVQVQGILDQDFLLPGSHRIVLLALDSACNHRGRGIHILHYKDISPPDFLPQVLVQ